jgi:hypothetical protein
LLLSISTLEDVAKLTRGLIFKKNWSAQSKVASKELALGLLLKILIQSESDNWTSWVIEWLI